MRQYKVLIIKTVEVEATSEEDAREKAYQAMSDNKQIEDFEFQTEEWD
jgi:ribosomal protein L20A (L18A)